MQSNHVIVTSSREHNNNRSRDLVNCHTETSTVTLRHEFNLRTRRPCIVAKRCVLEQKLLLTASMNSYNYEKSIGTQMTFV